MEEYIFLFVIAGIWSLFAAIQDLKTTMISDWLNYSLLAFALAYRAFYSVFVGSWDFFLYGLGGFGLFFILGWILYYSNVFAGGDAKLLWAFGAVLPFENLTDFLYFGLAFIFILFLAGGIYSLVYSAFLVRKRKKEFYNEFRKNLIRNKLVIVLGLVIGIFVWLYSIYYGNTYFIFLSVFVIIWPFLFVYSKALEKSVMIIMKKPKELIEGDWILEDIKLGKYVVKKTVHGLTKKDIQMLKNYNKKILVKNGVPFGPAFVISLILFLLYYFMGPFF